MVPHPHHRRCQAGSEVAEESYHAVVRQRIEPQSLEVQPIPPAGRIPAYEENSDRERESAQATRPHDDDAPAGEGSPGTAVGNDADAAYDVAFAGLDGSSGPADAASSHGRW